jgi:putative copper resistance protein D
VALTEAAVGFRTGTAESNRSLRVPVLVVAAVLAAGACLAVLHFGGSLREARLDAFGLDIGATPWLLPLATLATQLGAVLTVGFLLAAAFLVPGEESPGGRLMLGAQARAWLTGASAASLGWATAAVATMCLTLSDLLAVPVRQAASPDGLWTLATSLDLGRSLATVLVLAVVIALATRLVQSVTGAGVLVAIAVLATLPAAFGGHAAGSANHQLAVSTMMAHIGGAVLWTGGLVALLLGRRQLAPALARSAARFSRLALGCFVAVGLTGLVSAALRIGTWADLGTGYGLVVLLKLAALTGLGGFGWWHRRHTLPALAAGRPGAFARIAAVEVLVMAAAFGLAAGLARTPPPPGGRGGQLAPTPIRTVLNWLPDPLFLALAVTAVGCYLIGVRRLRRQGTAWPATRTLAWIGGWLAVCAATDLQLARAGQGTFLLMEKVQHLTLGVIAPILLVSGGGIALARQLGRPGSEPGLRSPSQWLAGVLDARATRALAHPAVTLALYAAALYGLYLSASVTLTLRSHAGHLVLFAAALVIAGFFYWPLLGVQTPPRALNDRTRLALLLAATLLQAVFGIALML